MISEMMLKCVTVCGGGSGGGVPKQFSPFYTRRRWPSGGPQIRVGGEMGGGGGGQGGSSNARRRSGGGAKSSLETPGRPDPLYAPAEGAQRRYPGDVTCFYRWFRHAAV